MENDKQNVYLPNEDIQKLSEGFLELYQPTLRSTKENLNELLVKQKLLAEDVHEGNLKLSAVDELNLKTEMFNKIKLYQNKLAIIKKDIKQLHENSVKLKNRAQKLEQQSRPNIKL